MTGLTILLLIATLGFAASQWLRMPVIPFLLIFGVVAGALTPNHIDREALEAMTDIGLAFLVFFAGLSLRPERLAGQVRAVLLISVVQFSAAATCGTLAAMAMGFPQTSALYLGAALGTSSTLVVVRHMQRTAPADYKRLALGVVLVQDAALIILIASLAHVTKGAQQMAVSLGVLALTIAGGIVLQRLLPRLTRKFRAADEELLLLSSLAFLFLFAGVAAVGGLAFVVGAFWAGFALSGFPLSGQVRAALDSLNTFFLAVFFVALGFRIEFAGGTYLLPAAALACVLFVVTPIVVTLLAERKLGLSTRSAITTGLLLSQTSEFSVILVVFGERLGHVPQGVTAIVTIIAVITMSLSAILAGRKVTGMLFALHPMHRGKSVAPEHHDHALMLGYGATGRYAIKPILDAGLPLVIIEQDPGVVRQLEAEGLTVIRGDASDPAKLARAGAAHARFILATLPDHADVVNVINLAGDTPVIARVFEQSHADAISAAGGKPVMSALATADTFMQWFDGFQSQTEQT